MKCKAKNCGKEIVFLLTKNNKPIPVDYDSLTDEEREYLINRKDDVDEMLKFDPTHHITHFITCSASKDFRKKEKKGMKILINKKKPEFDILLAFTDDDVEVLSYMFKGHRIFGFYKLVTVSDKNKDLPDAAPFLKSYPDVKAIGYLADHAAFKGAK